MSSKERGEINIKTGDFKKKKKEIQTDRSINKLKAGLTVFTSLEKHDDDLGVEFLTMKSVKSNHENVIFDEIIEKDQKRKIQFEKEKKKREEEMEKRKDICFQDTKISVLVPRKKDALVIDEEYMREKDKEIIIVKKDDENTTKKEE